MPAEEFERRYAAARDGDNEAREWLLARISNDLERFVRARSGHEVRARVTSADLTQMTMVAFLERLHSFPPELRERDLKARLLQIAKWKIADAVAKPREKHEGSVFRVRGEESDRAPSPLPPRRAAGP